jgi:hypothetical protein
MISKETKEKFLEELRSTGNVLFACKKVGIAKATIYRWRKKSKRFAKEFKDATEVGRSNIGDIAEHALLALVKEGDFPAVRFALNHNHENYKKSPERTVNINYSRSESMDENKQNQETLADVIAATVGIKLTKDIRKKKPK